MKHTKEWKRTQRGQALLLVTLSLFAMCGLLGLAVDLGWSYFVKKSAQNAADASALADAHRALAIVGETASFSGYTDDPANALWYAKQNGFMPGGDGGRQNVAVKAMVSQQVTLQDGTIVPPCSPALLVSCVEYSVTVRTAELIPQLFSAVLGNTSASPSARTTAAVVQVRVNGSLIVQNRAADNLGPTPPGATPSPITAPGGVTVAANIQPGTVINGPITALNSVANPGSSSFQNMADGPQFLDPLRGYGQPRLPDTALDTFAVIGSNLSSSLIYRIGTDKVADQSRNYGGGGSPTLPSGNYVPGYLGQWLPNFVQFGFP